MMMRILQLESLGCSVGSGGSVALCYDEHVAEEEEAVARSVLAAGGRMEAGNGRKRRRGMTDKRKREERSGEDTGVGGRGRGKGRKGQMMTSYLRHRCATRTYYAYLTRTVASPLLPPLRLNCENPRKRRWKGKELRSVVGRRREIAVGSRRTNLTLRGRKEGTRYDEKPRGVCVSTLRRRRRPCRPPSSVRTLSRPPRSAAVSSVFIAAAECRL